MEQDTIRVRRIELVDETGAPRAWLQADSQGMSGLVVLDPGGTGMKASIGINDDGAPFLMLGTEFRRSVFAGITSDGEAYVQVTDENGESKTLKV
jgi:hypothetical protein